MNREDCNIQKGVCAQREVVGCGGAIPIASRPSRGFRLRSQRSIQGGEVAALAWTPTQLSSMSEEPPSFALK
jgi:hypothetical protein